MGQLYHNNDWIAGVDYDEYYNDDEPENNIQTTMTVMMMTVKTMMKNSKT